MTKAQTNPVEEKIDSSEVTQNSATENTTAQTKEQETLKLPATEDKSLFDLENMSQEEKEQAGARYGYIPNKNFKGDPSRHMDVEEFLRVSERKMPALKNQIRKQDAIIENLRKMNEGLNTDIERQKSDLEHQFKEAAEDQDFYKIRSLEKQEKALEKRQDEIQKDMATLTVDQKQDNVEYHKEERGQVIGQWIQSNLWFNNPQNAGDYAKIGLVEKKFKEYEVAYPNADTNKIMYQIDTDLNQFTQGQSSNYNYTPGGNQNNSMGGQAPTKDKTEGNLNDGGKRMLRNIQGVARNPEERDRLTKNFLTSNTNDSLFKWHKDS